MYRTLIYQLEIATHNGSILLSSVRRTVLSTINGSLELQGLQPEDRMPYSEWFLSRAPTSIFSQDELGWAPSD